MNRHTKRITTKKIVMKSKLSIYLLLIVFAANSVIATAEVLTATVKGKVTDENNQPIEFATATLVNPKTKEILKGEVCNKKGEFSINKVNHGEYILSVSMLGFEKFETEKVVIDGKSAVIEKKIVLRENSEILKDVEIVAKKQFIEQSVDKMVINPEASITSSSENVYEIIRKLPGVTVDNNENISLKGLQGVKVLIDNKPTYVSGTQLASMLKGMQGKNIDKIEIIENPSARYDAEGNSGIINIKTKHTKAPGFNGNLNAGINYASKIGWNGGLDLNMNYGKFNLYGNYSNYNWAGWNSMDASRRFTSTALKGAYQLIKNNGDYDGTSNNYKIGADYFIAKNHVISAMFRGNKGHNINDERSTTSFTDKDKNVDSMLVSVAHQRNEWTNQTYNVNYKWDVDTLGQSLSVDMDYVRFGYTGPNNQTGKFTDKNGTNLNHDIVVNTDQGNTINIYTAKVDYNLPIGKNINFESGLKTSFVNTDSRINMNGFLTQNDHFVYNEDIQAAYVNGRFQLKKTTIQLGLRLENTVSKGTSLITNEVNDTSYLKIFPSLFVQQKLNEANSINFKYSYRIGRPSYHMLNPFKWMVDPYTYNVGNPYLEPQFTHSLGISHSYKSMLISSLGMNYTNGLFTEIIRQDDASKTVYQTNENLSNSIDLNLSETFQLQPFKWWQLRGTLTGMYKRLQLNENAGSRLSRYSMNGNINSNFTLPYKLQMEINGNYTSSQLVSNIIVRPQYEVDLGIQRNILKDQGTLKLSVNDVFNTSNGSAYAKYDNVDIDVINHWNSRRLSLSFNYRFGKDNFKTRSNRSTSSSEEQNRSSK